MSEKKNTGKKAVIAVIVISDQCASVIWCRCVQAGYRS